MTQSRAGAAVRGRTGEGGGLGDAAKRVMNTGTIGLLQVDGKYPNLALMHLGAYLRDNGQRVRWITPIEQDECETVYAAKVFQFTYDGYVRADAIRGGTGWPDWRDLPDLLSEAEHSYPAYDLAGCEYAMGFLTRGCIRKCPFCVVPDKEGHIHHHAHLSEWWRGQKQIRLLDANLTASPDAIGYLGELAASGAQVDFSQGLDARLVTPEFCAALAKVRRWGQVHTAWDWVDGEAAIMPGLRMLRDALPKGALMAYVLIGYNSTPEQDLYRVMKLREEKIDPFVMPYNKTDRYQRAFARWVNHKAVFKSCTWDEYYGCRQRLHPN